MDYIKNLITEDFIKKLAAIIILIMLFVALSSIKSVLFLSFIFTFAFYKSRNYIYNKVNKKIPISKKIITISLYLMVLIALVFAAYEYIPLLIKEIFELKEQFFASNQTYSNELISNLCNKIKSIDYEGLIAEDGVGTLVIMKDVLVSTGIAYILSFFLLIEENEIKELDEKLLKSKISYIYSFYKNIGEKFTNSFAVIMETQLLIAFINSILSGIFLVVLGFPSVIGLSFMIFLLSLIPVFGTIISLIPLSIIAFKLGGIPKIIQVIVMIIIIHGLESYVINPKLMSAKTHLPVFITFFILFLSEHYMGVWGLIIGLPMFIFFLDIADIK